MRPLIVFLLALILPVFATGSSALAARSTGGAHAAPHRGAHAKTPGSAHAAVGRRHASSKSAHTRHAARHKSAQTTHAARSARKGSGTAPRAPRQSPRHHAHTRPQVRRVSRSGAKHALHARAAKLRTDRRVGSVGVEAVPRHEVNQRLAHRDRGPPRAAPLPPPAFMPARSAPLARAPQLPLQHIARASAFATPRSTRRSSDPPFSRSALAARSDRLPVLLAFPGEHRNAAASKQPVPVLASSYPSQPKRLRGRFRAHRPEGTVSRVVMPSPRGTV
jgi:hypothetical protein